MSRGTSGAVLAPVHTEGDDVSDHRLVAAVRRGDDRAFEALYQRYHRRINAYVLGMVKDHGRAEDVTQEVFVSALRRMRATERPIAFKPWIYEIAKNGCIDAFRRSRRTDEVSYDADEGLAPADRSRLVGSGPSPDAAVAAKQDLADLCGAFGGLSESHHQILVLRELEGLSYDQIGERMGMTRPAVESTLFRARRRLTEEYDELASGARCIRVQGIIAAAAEASGSLGARDSRRLSRHLSHCQSCRREALAAGLDRGLLVRRPLGERIAGRVAGFLPFPVLARLRPQRAGGEAAPGGGGGGARFAAHLPAFSDQLAHGWGKVATGAALLVAGLGAGAAVQHEISKRPDGNAAAGRPGGAAVQPSHPAAASRSTVTTVGGGRADVVTPPSHAGGTGSAGRHDAGRSGGTAGATPATEGGATAPTVRAGTVTAASDRAATPRLPRVGLPVTTSNPIKEVAEAVATIVPQVAGAVQKVTDAADGAAKGLAGTIEEAAQGLPAAGPAAQAVQDAPDAVTTPAAGVAAGAGKLAAGATERVTSGAGTLVDGGTGNSG